MIWADKPRSIIYAVILHEVCSALFRVADAVRPAEKAGCPIKLQAWWPRTLPGQPSCDGTPSELCVIDLITQHDVTANEKFPGGGGFGFGPPPPRGQALIETLQVVVLFDRRMRGFDQQVAQHARAGFADPQEMFALGRRAFHGFEPGISSHLPLIAKAADRPERVHHTERG